MGTLLIIILSILLAKTVLFAINHVVGPKQRRLPPGPRPFPVIGNLHQLGGQPLHEAMTRLAATYGPIMILKVGSVDTVVVSSPKLAKQVLIHHGDRFSTPFTIDVAYAHHHDRHSVGWLPASSPLWHSLRKAFGLLFTNAKLDASAEWRHLAVADLVDRVRDCSRRGVVVDVSQAVLSAFCRIMLNTVFSRDVLSNVDNPREIEELMFAILQEMGNPNMADCFPMLHLVDPQGIRRRLTALCGKLFKVFNGIVDSRLRMRKETKGGDGVNGEDALDLILDALDDRKGITREVALHILLDIIGPGIDASSKAAEWAMAELLNHPEALRKAQEELEKTVEKGKPVKDSDICKLPYLQAVLNETFRLHPPVPLLPPRKTEEDIEFYGYTIPKGSRVLVNFWAIGRDPDSWECPESFAPERFLDTSNVEVKIRRQELIPFSGGRRMCPGVSLASRTALTVIGSMINCFDWKLEDQGGDVDMRAEFRVTLKKAKPLRAIPIDRVYID